MLVAGCLLGLVARERHRSRRRGIAALAILEHGAGRIVIDQKTPRRSAAMGWLLGKEHVGNVRKVCDWWGSDVAGALVHIQAFPELQELDLHDTQAADADLVHLRSLTRLERLDLSRTNVTAVGVKNLQTALPNCQIIH
jgi:hypothetical protein